MAAFDPAFNFSLLGIFIAYQYPTAFITKLLNHVSRDYIDFGFFCYYGVAIEI